MEIEKLNIEGLLEIAKTEMENVKENEVFKVKDLFQGISWNRIPIGNRTRLGILFAAYVDSEEGSKILESVGKTTQNQQKYKKR